MRTETIKICLFQELSKKAQEVVLERERTRPDRYSWADEAIDSLKQFCEHFGLTDLRYSVSAWEPSFCSAKLSREDHDEMRGVRVWKFLHNSNLISGNLLEGECPFTGYWIDEELLEPIREFLKKPNSDLTYQDLMNECLQKWVKDFQDEEEYAYSDEAIKEDLEVNDLEFLEDGREYL